MTARTQITLLSAVLLLLAALYAASFVFSADSAQSRASREALFPAFRPGDAAKVSIERAAGAPIVMERRSNGWATRLGSVDVPIAPLRVQSLLSSIGELSRAKLVSSDAARLADFSLGAATGPGVAVSNARGETIASVLVGKKGESGYEDYLRLPGDDRVYLTRSSMSFFVAQEPSYWYDLSIFPDEVQGPTIVAITIDGDLPLDATGTRFTRGSYTIERTLANDQPQWRFAGTTVAVNQLRADVSANALGSLQGVDFIADAKPLETAAHRLTVTVRTVSGATFSFTAGASHLAGYWVVQGKSSDYLYVVGVDALMRAVAPRAELSADSAQGG